METDGWVRMWLLLCACLWATSLGQIVYTVSEEMDKGTVVGNIAKDLKIGVHELESRMFQIVSGSSKKYFEVNMKTGALFVNERVDREEVCEHSQRCVVNVEALAQNPHNLYRIEINVLDVNDNAPRFLDSAISMNITEDASPGERFHLPVAEDADVGSNSLKDYRLSTNEYFSIDVQSGEPTVSVELVLQKALDREKQSAISLVLTALDGGKPQKTGTLHITIHVIDVNDNKPVFNKPLYKVKIRENIAVGAKIISLTATDLDEGTNSELVYSFFGRANAKTDGLFTVIPETGDIVVKNQIDHEETPAIELRVQARDKGSPPRMSVIFLLSLIGLIAAKCCGSEGGLSRYSDPVVTTHPDGSWSYSKATQQYDVCFSSDTLKSDVVVFPSPFPPADAELISINGGDTFSRTQTLPSSGKVRL
ncbi:hypothetical protein SRHO_G00213760 [Serrasalmus rhombeus]